MIEYMQPYTNEQLQMVKDEQIAQLDKAAREEKAALERRGQGGKLALIVGSGMMGGLFLDRGGRTAAGGRWRKSLHAAGDVGWHSCTRGGDV